MDVCRREAALPKTPWWTKTMFGPFWPRVGTKHSNSNECGQHWLTVRQARSSEKPQSFPASYNTGSHHSPPKQRSKLPVLFLILVLCKFSYVCVHGNGGWGYMCAEEDHLQKSLLSFHTIWVPEIGPRSSVLVPSALTSWRILLALIFLFIYCLFTHLPGLASS